MNTITMIEAFSNLDDDLVEKHFKQKEALKVKKANKNKSMWIKWGSIAACFCLIIAISISLFFSPQFDGRLIDEYPADQQGNITENKYPFVSMQIEADWPYYDTAKEVVGASTNIYHGIVTDISFAIIDSRTGLVDHSPESASYSRMLYTIYTISVVKNYKGELPTEVKLCVMGGLAGYHEQEQYELMNASGLLSKYQGIVISNETNAALAIGNEYLFCTCRTIGDFEYIINPIQFAHDINSKNSNKIINECAH